MRALAKYRRMLYGGDPAGEQQDSPTSLYAGATNTLRVPKKKPARVAEALATSESTESVMTQPRVDLLSQFRKATEDPKPAPVVGTDEILDLDQNNPIGVYPKPTEPINVGNYSGFDVKKFTKQTVRQESGGDYRAMGKGESTATGKYQFLWGKTPDKGWQKDIQRVTGVRTREEFRDSPDAQEKFYKYYVENHIVPQVKKLSVSGAKIGLTPTEVGRVIHFQGAGGAAQAFKGGVKSLYKATKINPSIMSYLGKTK